jgi:hypothetical protein
MNSAPEGLKSTGSTYLEAVVRFADAVLEHGRDAFGTTPTPLFVDGLHAKTLLPATWACRGQT